MSADNLRLGVDGSALVASLSGEIDLSNAEELSTRVLEATPADSVGVVLDLTEVSYLDSVGIYVIFGLREHLTQRGQALTLVIPGDSPIQPAMRLAHVARRMEVAETIGAARRALAGPDS